MAKYKGGPLRTPSGKEFIVQVKSHDGKNWINWGRYNWRLHADMSAKFLRGRYGRGEVRVVVRGKV